MKIKKNSLYSAVLISATALSLTAPTIANAANEHAHSEQAVQSEKQNENKDNKSIADKNDKKSDSSINIVNSNDKKSETIVKNDDKKPDPDNPQNLKEQTMVIHKVVAASEKDLNTNDLKGVNGAKFAVYDVSDLMNTIIKEELKTDGSKASDKDIDNAIAKADENSKNETAEVAGDKTDDKQDLKSSDAKKDDNIVDKDKEKLPPKYESGNKSKSQDKATEQSQKDSKTTEQGKKDKVDKEADDASKDKSTSQDSSEIKAKDDKDDLKASNNADSDKKQSDEDTALIEKVEKMRKDDTIRKKIAERAAKLDPKQMKKFADVTTGHDDTSKKDGIARVKIPIDGKYHAYYVVNTETPKEAMAKNSDPIVVITPITDDDGKYSSEFAIYPKSERITPNNPESKKPVVTEAKMYQTGKQGGFWNNIISYLQSIFN